MAGNVGHGDGSVRVECGGHRSDRCVETMVARPDASEVGEGGDQADGPMAAHAEHSDVVEEEDSRGAIRGVGWDQEGADQHV